MFAGRLAGQGRSRGEAARFQYWAGEGGRGGRVQPTARAGPPLAGDVEGAFYWLQEAALDDGVDASWADQDPDLASLRKDARWGQVAPFLKRCNAPPPYWAASGHRQTVLVPAPGLPEVAPRSASWWGCTGSATIPPEFVATRRPSSPSPTS